jgi:hypothetical protein
VCISAVLIECASGRSRILWRKTWSKNPGAVSVLSSHSTSFHFDITMDWHTASVQQARVSSFLTQLLATTAKFRAQDDDVIPREEAQLQQRLHWDQFVRIHEGRPLFRRHLRMSYDSFCTLLSLIRYHIASTDAKMASLRSGQRIYELYLYVDSLSCRCIVFRHMLFL